ncbi:MAG: Histidine ammonia-lyase, partial [Candidatus Jorgensenbacteria bacterium GW2011_GWA2_45_13]
MFIIRQKEGRKQALLYAKKKRYNESMSKNTLEVGPDHHLTPKLVSEVAHNPKAKVILSPRAKKKILASRRVVERIVRQRKVVYGITTGFGSFKDTFIEKEDVRELQRNLIRSHSSGVGRNLSPEMVRAAMLVRLNSLAQGYSGVRLEFLEFLVTLINRNIVPVVPSQGSVGSSGDLAPLSHIGLVMMGEGEVWQKGKVVNAATVLKKARLSPPGFMEKEGLAFNNGTSVMTGIAAVAFHKAEHLVEIADLGASLTLEAVCGITKAYDPRVQNIRFQPGQTIVAKNIRDYIKGSKLVDTMPERVQDSYSLRCVPQVHGAIRDALRYVRGVVEGELNSVTDNPLIFTNPDEAISGGNFHGEPIALAMDMLGIALAELADIAERRIAKLIDPTMNGGLPIFLIPKEKGGLHNGLMIPQYVAASLVSENKVLAHPASVDSIPTSVNQEDHVSMGTIAARKAWEIILNTENVLAIEYLNATQAIDMRDPKKLGEGTKKAYRAIRKKTSFIKSDRILAKDIEKV